jgi:hypothetical protein
MTEANGLKDYHIRINPEGYNLQGYRELVPIALHVQPVVKWDGELVIELVAEFPGNRWLTVGRSGFVKTGDRDRAIAFAQRRADRLTADGLDEWWWAIVDKKAIDGFAELEKHIAYNQNRLADERRQHEELRARRAGRQDDEASLAALRKKLYSD